MENIKYINKITEYIAKPVTLKPIGNCIYIVLANGNRIKSYCESDGVRLEVINSKEGKVDSAFLPFCNYFQAVRCSANAPLWYQSIDRDGLWRFEKTYQHVLPKDSDYESLADAITDYIELFS